MSSASASAAVTRLDQLIIDIQQKQTPKTLACWRLNNPKIVQSLHEFASTTTEAKTAETASEDDGALLDEVQTLFRDKLNPLLAEQENSDEGKAAFPSPSLQAAAEETEEEPNNNDYDDIDDEISVVFGGKYSNNPSSISEVLVSKLVASASSKSSSSSSHVITVSRSDVWVNELPSKLITHISKQNLDSNDKSGIGVEEFENVMNFAISKALNANAKNKKIAFYFTLGQHKGINPFNRNIQAATNFCQALEKAIGRGGLGESAEVSWRVVLTGTDATLPSTYPDGKVTICEEEYVVPTYKIMKYNYTYAMSKLGQYYLVVNTIAKLVDKVEIVNETKPIIEKITKHVSYAKEDGDYHPEKKSLIQMDELDLISNRIIELSKEQLLQDHFWIASGISICYTPLHVKPWTEAALKTDDPKGYIIEQIVRRFKNAISIERAANLHFPFPPSTTN